MEDLKKDSYEIDDRLFQFAEQTIENIELRNRNVPRIERIE